MRYLGIALVNALIVAALALLLWLAANTPPVYVDGMERTSSFF